MPPFERLTDRQRECLRYVAQGYTSKEISSRLGGLSHNTIDNHIAAALVTLNLPSRAEAARGLIAFEATSAQVTSGPQPLVRDPIPQPVGTTSGWSLLRTVPPLGGRLHDLSAEKRAAAILTISVIGFVVLIALTLGTVVLLMLLR